jgi:hypothetical protein
VRVNADLRCADIHRIHRDHGELMPCFLCSLGLYLPKEHRPTTLPSSVDNAMISVSLRILKPNTSITSIRDTSTSGSRCCIFRLWTRASPPQTGPKLRTTMVTVESRGIPMMKGCGRINPDKLSASESTRGTNNDGGCQALSHQY